MTIIMQSKQKYNKSSTLPSAICVSKLSFFAFLSFSTQYHMSNVYVLQAAMGWRNACLSLILLTYSPAPNYGTLACGEVT